MLFEKQLESKARATPFAPMHHAIESLLPLAGEEGTPGAQATWGDEGKLRLITPHLSHCYRNRPLSSPARGRGQKPFCRGAQCTNDASSAFASGKGLRRTMHQGAYPGRDRISGPDPGHFFTMSISGRHGTSIARISSTNQEHLQGVFALLRILITYQGFEKAPSPMPGMGEGKAARGGLAAMIPSTSAR